MLRFSRLLASTALTMFTSVSLALAAPTTGEDVIYKDGDVELQGYVARPATKDLTKRPAVLIVHNWKGLKEYEKMRANMLAELGYVAFAVDVYGKGVRPTEAKEAGEMAGKYKGDIPLFRQRLKAALDTVLARQDVDPARVAIAGYCFGGTGALELARSGADIVGAVSFHGSLGTPKPEDAKNIKGSILALHGADDPHVPEAEVAAFRKEMTDAKVDWQLVYYGNAVHSFTEREAGDDNSKGAAYNEKADKRSWKLFTSFLEEVFGTQSEAGQAANTDVDAEKATLTINVANDGTPSIEGKNLSLEEIQSRLVEFKQASSQGGVVIRPSKETSHAHLTGLVEAAKTAGISDLAIAEPAAR